MYYLVWPVTQMLLVLNKECTLQKSSTNVLIRNAQTRSGDPRPQEACPPAVVTSCVCYCHPDPPLTLIIGILAARTEAFISENSQLSTQMIKVKNGSLLGKLKLFPVYVLVQMFRGDF